MAKYFCLLSTVIVTSSFSLNVHSQILSNFKIIKINTKNDAKNDWRVDEDTGRNQREFFINNGHSQDLIARKGLQTLSKINEQLSTLQDLIQYGVKYNNKHSKGPLQISLQSPKYNDIPSKANGNPFQSDKSFESIFLNNIFRKNSENPNVVQQFQERDDTARAMRDTLNLPRRIKRLARNPKDTKGKKERKRKAQKRRKKRKKERMKKHMMRVKKQQSDKIKRQEKLKSGLFRRQNVTKNETELKEADPNYDELYEISVEEKMKKDSEEDYAHYNDPIPATDEMASDDWRHVKYSVREKNSSECESEWFDDINLSNMTDSEIDRKFPTQESDESGDSEYSSSISTKIEKNIHKKTQMMTKDKSSKEESSKSYVEENSGSKKDEEEGGSYEEDESNGGYEDGEYEASYDYDQPDKKDTTNKKTDAKGKDLKGRSISNCMNGNCAHEGHKSKKQSSHNNENNKLNPIGLDRPNKNVLYQKSETDSIIQQKQKMKRSKTSLKTKTKTLNKKTNNYINDINVETRQNKQSASKVKEYKGKASFENKNVHDTNAHLQENDKYEKSEMKHDKVSHNDMKNNNHDKHNNRNFKIDAKHKVMQENILETADVKEETQSSKNIQFNNNHVNNQEINGDVKDKTPEYNTEQDLEKMHYKKNKEQVIKKILNSQIPGIVHEKLTLKTQNKEKHGLENKYSNFDHYQSVAELDKIKKMEKVKDHTNLNKKLHSRKLDGKPIIQNEDGDSKAQEVRANFENNNKMKDKSKIALKIFEVPQQKEILKTGTNIHLKNIDLVNLRATT